MALFFMKSQEIKKHSLPILATLTNFGAIFSKFSAVFHQLRWSYAKQARLCVVILKKTS